MFASLTVLAPGLLGGSVAKAARSRGVARHIRVWSRRAETRAEIQGLGWCDSVAATAAEAVRDSECVVICAPVDHIVPLVEQIRPALAPGAIVTDVGSVKSAICRRSHGLLAGHARFVGSHPMAGSDRTGHAHAEADLFRGRTCFVTPLHETDAGALETVVAFWRALDAVVVTETPERHDEIVAYNSHLPHVLASTLCSLLARRDPRWRDLAGSGLRDTTRIAASDSDLWRAIFEQNREEVLRSLSAYEDELAAFRAALANQDMFAVRAILERGREYRDGLRG
ncbi:MAG: prephenate dehydrogenase/arogenate dehydrogenase family protein [Opitutaceae bacterium]|nr:prephenate dehydrogenase/arogenate dehydrogenase family protein [Opitutaceae bacterium]